jgi:hypothetical protein
MTHGMNTAEILRPSPARTAARHCKRRATRMVEYLKRSMVRTYLCRDRCRYDHRHHTEPAGRPEGRDIPLAAADDEDCRKLAQHLNSVIVY